VTDRAHLFTAMQALLDRDGSRDGLCAVLVVRLRGMREAQLRYGYDFGSEIMHTARERIGGVLRHVDKVFFGADDTFVLLLPAMRNRTHALLAATRLVAAFDEPLNCPSRPWHGRAVIGAALHPEHGAAAELLCRRAEIAHDEALRIGEPFAMYQPDATQVEILYSELREDIEANRLQVHFQPVIDVRTRAVARLESLARWTTRHHGDVTPADFIPFAERSDLIVPLTRWSLNASLRHAAVLHEAGRPLDVAINLSPRVFVEQGFAEQFLGAMEIWSVPPTSVVVEVTETALLTDLDMSVRVLRRLRDAGVRVAIDDFGTGYASFAYLRHFPATELKIDKSFVEVMHTDERTAQLVRAMIDVAHRLGLEAVAEGVENEQTLAMIADMGCDLVQGFYVGRPEPAGELMARWIAAAPVS
jgi:EAL domain-containing protein (putative c-di-GMP-specific phosphodiesterase class I)